MQSADGRFVERANIKSAAMTTKYGVINIKSGLIFTPMICRALVIDRANPKRSAPSPTFTGFHLPSMTTTMAI